MIEFGLKIRDGVGAGEPEPSMCLLHGSSGAGKLYTWRLALGFFELTGLKQESDGRLFACHTAPVTDSSGDVTHHAFSVDAVHEQSGRMLFVDETSRGARIVQSADALEVYQFVNAFVDE